MYYKPITFVCAVIVCVTKSFKQWNGCQEVFEALLLLFIPTAETNVRLKIAELIGHVTITIQSYY